MSVIGRKRARATKGGRQPNGQAVATLRERIMNDPFWLRRFAVDEYDKMVENGILTTNDRVELLKDGSSTRCPRIHRIEILSLASFAALSRFCRPIGP